MKYFDSLPNKIPTNGNIKLKKVVHSPSNSMLNKPSHSLTIHRNQNFPSLRYSFFNIALSNDAICFWSHLRGLHIII